MRIIEIIALDNGAHRNQSWGGSLEEIPEGFAVIPEDMAIPQTFPFVDIETDIADGCVTVTKMTAGIMPEPEPEPAPQPTLADRIGTLEEQLAQSDETAISLFESVNAQEQVNAEQDEMIIEIFESLSALDLS